VDRLLVVVSDLERGRAVWSDVLGAEAVREDSLESLRSHRVVLGLGASEIELLLPTGPGPVADHLGAWGEGIFAAGFAVSDVRAMRERLADAGVRWTEEGPQIFVDPSETRGMGTVLSPLADREAPSLLSHLYEVTHIVRGWKEVQEEHARVFGLAPDRFCEIESENFGYTGQLLLFEPPTRLDRIELVQVTQREAAMGRFFQRRGESIYMSYAECPDPAALVERLRSRSVRFTAPPDDDDPDNLWIHPSGLTGVLLGVSRTNHGWTWSGRPELARR
jgi:catechol 2,3-dioxygenase-like lactoylglutathione lyase family enzyme